MYSLIVKINNKLLIFLSCTFICDSLINNINSKRFQWGQVHKLIDLSLMHHLHKKSWVMSAKK